MTPIYKSPDRDEAEAILALLSEHNICASISKSTQADHLTNHRSICWYELWLRNQSDIKHAEAIITQFEFINYKNSLGDNSFSESYQKIFAESDNSFPEPDDTLLDDVTPAITSTAPRNTHENLTPINNKRVFRRLGLLLGFTEEQIEALDNNKLYRPWDGDRLMEQVNKLKRKCT